jgi:hypothetical protein
MARDVGDDGRLGGPPGLYDSCNSDRGGGLVQRIRVPADPRPEFSFPWGVTSLNDSDNDEDALGDASAADSGPSLGEGVAFRKSLTGSDM